VKLILQRPGQRLVNTEPKTKSASLDLAVVATEVEALPSEDSVVKYLADDKRLTAPALIQLCKQMNVVEPTSTITDLRAGAECRHTRRSSGHWGEHRDWDDPLDLILILVEERRDGDESVPERIALLAMGTATETGYGAHRSPQRPARSRVGSGTTVVPRPSLRPSR